MLINNMKIAYLIGVLLILIVFTSGCSLTNTDVVIGDGIEKNAPQPNKTVSIRFFSFDPQEIRVNKGDAVIWINKDTVPHTVKSELFYSDNINPGENFTYKFDKLGSYPYSCTQHPQMIGTVVVE